MSDDLRIKELSHIIEELQRDLRALKIDYSHTKIENTGLHAAVAGKNVELDIERRKLNRVMEVYENLLDSTFTAIQAALNTRLIAGNRENFSDAEFISHIMNFRPTRIVERKKHE